MTNKEKKRKRKRINGVLNALASESAHISRGKIKIRAKTLSHCHAKLSNVLKIKLEYICVYYAK